jgi:hypothetical protein
MVAAAATLVLIWTATTDTPLPERINESLAMGAALRYAASVHQGMKLGTPPTRT